MKLELQLDSDRVAPGKELTGHVLVLEGGESRSLTLTVGFHERSPSYASVPFTESGVLHQGNLATGQTVEFRFKMPEWAAPGVKGKHAELFWELETTSDEPGLDTSVRRRIDVVSAGE